MKFPFLRLFRSVWPRWLRYCFCAAAAWLACPLPLFAEHYEAGSPKVLSAGEAAALFAAHDDPLPGLAPRVEELFNLGRHGHSDGVVVPHPDTLLAWARPPGLPLDGDCESWLAIVAQYAPLAVSTRSDDATYAAREKFNRALRKLSTPAARSTAARLADIMQSISNASASLDVAIVLCKMQALDQLPKIAATLQSTAGKFSCDKLLRALAELKHKECQDLLYSLIKLPIAWDTLAEIASVLDEANDPRCVEAAHTYLQKTGYDDGEKVKAVLRVLRKYPDGNLPAATATLLHKDHPALRELGLEAAEEFNVLSEKPAIVKLLDPAQPAYVRLRAIKTLASLGSPEYTADLPALLVASKSTPAVTQRPPPQDLFDVLASLHWSEAIPVLVKLLGPENDWSVRNAAREAISHTTSLGDSAPVSIRQKNLALLKSSGGLEIILRLLKNNDEPWAKRDGLQTLVNISYDGPPSVIEDLLNDPDPRLVVPAIHALGSLGMRSAVPSIAKQLASPDPDIVFTALQALAKLQAVEFAGLILEQLQNPDFPRRPEALDTLVQLQSVNLTDPMLALFQADDADLRTYAVQYVTRRGLERHVMGVGRKLLDSAAIVREAVRAAMATQGQTLPPALFPVYLEAAAVFPHEKTTLMLDAYYHFGGDPLFCRVLRWMGDRESALRPALPADAGDARQTVSALQKVWTLAEPQAHAHAVFEAGSLAAAIIQASAWQSADAAWLHGIAGELGRFPDLKQKAASVRAVADTMHARQPLQRLLRFAGWFALLQPLVWIILLFVYPWWIPAQRAVWSRAFRRVAGCGWVGPLITRCAWLRERMWRPFREALVPPGEVVTFDEWTFFDAVRVTPAAGGESMPALKTLADSRGPVVLSGESGLGKTTLLHALAARAPRPVAFLRAVECSAGLLEALRQRLPSHARGDAAFLRTLVQKGSPDIFVDAVHEAPAEVRARLADEVNSFPGANILLTTQPVSWPAPRSAAEWRLQPLQAREIEPFLLKQGTAALEASGPGSLEARHQAFASRASSFLHHLETLPPDSVEALALRRMLGNPMEAVLAAELLAAGQTPDPNRLLAQRMEHLTEDYLAEQGIAFPASSFAEHLRSWRDSGAPLLRLDIFAGVAAFLARRRLLRKTAGGTETWRFRHDKILEWFLRSAGS